MPTPEHDTQPANLEEPGPGSDAPAAHDSAAEHGAPDSAIDIARPTDEFLAACAQVGLAFEPGELERYGAFLRLLMEANARFNLTAIRDRESAWMRHIYDSLSLLPVVASLEGVQRIADVGSGGGLPAIPLAIALPNVRFTLIESTGKKAAFLREAADALGLGNIEVVNDRAEVLGRDREHHREQYDIVTARAVGPLRVLLELTVPLARLRGLVLAIKGGKAAEEVDEAKAALHALHSAVIEQLRGETGTIVVVEKRRVSPKIYPRRPGEPKRAPIGGKA